MLMRRCLRTSALPAMCTIEHFVQTILHYQIQYARTGSLARCTTRATRRHCSRLGEVYSLQQSDENSQWETLIAKKNEPLPLDSY